MVKISFPEENIFREETIWDFFHNFVMHSLHVERNNTTAAIFITFYRSRSLLIGEIPNIAHFNFAVLKKTTYRPEAVKST